MSQEYIEVSEKTLDDAITTACQKLSVTSDKLDYIIIDHGSAGFLGFNARNAVIKARIKEASAKAEKVYTEVLEKVRKKEDASETAAQIQKPVSAGEDKSTGETAAQDTSSAGSEAQANKQSDTSSHNGNHDGNRGENHGQRREHRRRERNRKGNAAKENPVPAEPVRNEKKEKESRHTDEPKREYTQEQIAAASARAEEFLSRMFDAMDLDVSIRSEFDKNENILSLDFIGDDMGVLIGKRGQTLDAIQYLASLVVNKDMEGYIHVKVDTENYRERRKKTLENLAKNIAYKVKKTRKSVALEPMNPYERRIIHSSLQSDKYVTTYSEGEEPFRKVIVTLKK